jgi:salicylate hydroxylase
LCHSIVSLRFIFIPDATAELLPSGFMPSELTTHHQEGFEFKEVPVEEIIQGNYNELDPNCVKLLRHSADRMPWRMYVHKPYEYWHKGRACIMGDAAHPMLVS